MPTYLVTLTDPRTPSARFTAPDLIDLGEQVAAWLAQRRQLVRGYSYEARIGNDRGAIRQAGHVLTFTIRKEA